MITVEENAIHAWVVRGSGVPAAQVFWVGQNGPMPARPFLTLQLRSEKAVGTDWLDTTLTPGLPVGAELTHTVQGVRLGRLSIQCYTTDATGAASAGAILARTVAALALPSVEYALTQAGVAIGIIGDVVQVPEVDIDQATPRNRANLDLSINLVNQGPSETGTRIETFEISSV